MQLDNLDEQHVEEALADGSGEDSVRLELGDIDGDQIDPIGVGLLHSVFLADPRPLEVSVSGAGLTAAFPRLGLASAVSRGLNRSATPEGLYSQDWAWTWTPGSRLFANALFSGPEGPDAAPALSGPDYATFNDPHLTHPAAGLSRMSSLVRRWLHRRLETQAGAGVEETISRAGFYISELVANVREHAVSDDREPIRSQAWIALTGGAQALRLTICVVDSGPGIEFTLRRKLPAEAPAGKQLFEDLLNGRLPGWGRARGIGLSRCYEIAEGQDGATMLVASGAYRCRNVAGADVSVTEASALSGTLVVVTLPV